MTGLSVIRREEPAKKPGIREPSAQDRPIEQRGAKRRRWIIAAVSVAVLVAVIVAVGPAWQRWISSERSVSRDRIRTAQVQVGTFVRDVSVQGTTVAAISPTLYAPAAGTVTLETTAGAAVDAGQVLAVIYSPELENQLRQEQASLQGVEVELGRQRIEARQRALASRQAADLAKVRITAAERELRRAEHSWDLQVISAQDLEKARDEVASAELEYQHALQDAELVSETVAFEVRTRELARDRQALLVRELERQVAELTVRSPVTGVIGDLATEQKANIAANQPLFTVVDLSAFEVELRVPEIYADDLVAGQAVTVRYGAGSYDAAITAVSPEVADNQVRARARFSGELPPGIRQNQRVSATVLLERKPNALYVQRGPFIDSGGGRVAYVVQGDRAVRRPIETGSSSVSAVEITGGLEPGETIVISGTDDFASAESVLLTN